MEYFEIQILCGFCKILYWMEGGYKNKNKDWEISLFLSSIFVSLKSVLNKMLWTLVDG
jgi:hypothetical protein